MLNKKSEAKRLEAAVAGLEKSMERHTSAGSSIRITNWIKTLKAHSGFQPIIQDLEELKIAVTKRDGEKIYKLLDSLGRATVNAAEKADNQESSAIKKLGETLLKGSKFVKKLLENKRS